MKILPMDFQERVIYSLRTLYNASGYAQYKMSKFEEYDLYARNKDFLISDGIITFMDTNGKLMALKPDVTLSIIKNSKDDPESVSKVYYNENVYRISKGTRSFKELMQVGQNAWAMWTLTVSAKCWNWLPRVLRPSVMTACWTFPRWILSPMSSKVSA